MLDRMFSSEKTRVLYPFAAGLLSPALGLLAAKIHPILLPLIMTLAIYPLYYRDLEEDMVWRAFWHVLAWSLACTVMMILLTIYFGAGISELILKGGSYRREMYSWIATGIGEEGDPRLFVKPKIIEIAVFSALSLVSAGFLGLFLGSILLNYMNFYVGCLFLDALPGYWWVPALFGWPIYAILRVPGYIALGIVLSRPLIRLKSGEKMQWGRAGRLAALALALILLDFALKATLANRFYQPILKKALGL